MAALTLHSFIISWAGRHEKAAAIAKAVASTSNTVTVVYSDPDENQAPKFPCPAIRRPNSLLWEDKFRATLHACRSDILLVIHADCECDDWSKVPSSARKTFADVPRAAVWSPLLDGTIHNITRTLIHDIKGTDYSVVSQTDGIVFAITRPIMERMKKAVLDKNPHGWGIDTMINCCSYSKAMLSIVDRGMAVHHPQGSGYDRSEAQHQMNSFLEQLTPEEETIYQFMRTVQRYAKEAARLAREQGLVPPPPQAGA